MMALNGAISLKELLQMPLRQYIVLRKMVDIVEFEKRKTYIHDTAMAFSDPQKAISEIDSLLKDLNINKKKSKVSWDSDKTAIDRAKKKWMR